MNFDAFGAIIQDPPSNNAGDSCNRGFQYCALTFVIKRILRDPWFIPKKDFHNFLACHELKPGVFVRHPWIQPWSNPLNVTKDQLLFVLVALGLYCDRKRAWVQLFKHIFRLGFYPNIQRDYPGSWKRPWKHKAFDSETLRVREFGPDFADWSWPQDWGVFMRATRFPLFWPLLWITDFCLWCAVIIHCHIYSKDPDNVDDMQLLGMFIQATRIMPTVFSRTAIEYYFQNRPVNLGNIAHVNQGKEDQYLLPYDERHDGVMGAIAWYFRPQWVSYPGKGTNFESPDFVDLWRPVIKWLRKENL